MPPTTGIQQPHNNGPLSNGVYHITNVERRTCAVVLNANYESTVIASLGSVLTPHGAGDTVSRAYLAVTSQIYELSLISGLLPI
jgi:hypothetical protein